MVSDKNRVKSLAKTIVRSDGVEVFIPERLVGVHKTSDGYLMTRISKNNIAKNHLIHRLIAIANIKNELNYAEVNHKDGNKLNNNIDNLEWVNHRQNMKHARFNNLIKNIPKGQMCYQAKLKNQDVINIFNSCDAGVVAAKKYGVTTSTICSIRKGRTWTHITNSNKTGESGFNK